MIRSGLMLVGAILASAFPASAQLAQIYISNEGQSSLQQLNFTTGQLTTLYEIGAEPDDLTLNSSGQLIYSVPTTGIVYLYDPNTKTNSVLVSGIPACRDLEMSLDGSTLYIAKHNSPAQIWKYSFVTKTASIVVPKRTGITTYDGLAFDQYGNFYAVTNHNTIVQINPATGATINTLVIEPHNGINGGDGLTYDSYTNSLWATHDGKTSLLGFSLLQIPVQASGFVSTSPGFTSYAVTLGNVDGIKSDGKGNLYIGAIHTAAAYNIPSHTVVADVVTKGADGVYPVPGTY